MKFATQKKDDKKSNASQLKQNETEAPAKVLSPPPFSPVATDTAPVQTKSLAVSGDSEHAGSQESAEQEGKKGSGSVQFKQADGAASPNGNGTAQLKKEDNEEQGLQMKQDGQAVQRQEDGQAADLEQGAQQQVDITIPGAFDITDGPDKFHEYIMAAVGSLLSNTFTVNLNFNVKLGIKASVLKGLVGIGGGGTFGVSCTLNRQDDRLIRGGYAIKYGGQFVSELLWFINYTKEWAGKSSKTAVFRDMYHFGAQTFDVLAHLYNKVAEHSDGELTPFEYGEWSGESGDMNWEALANRPTTKVTGQEWSTSETLSAGVGEYKAEGSRGTSNSTSRFYRQTGQGDDQETITRTSTQKVREASLSAEAHGVGVSVGMAYTDIHNHANQDNDGNYKNLSITLTNFPRMASLRAGIAKDIQSIKTALAGTESPLITAQLALSLVVGFVKGQIGKMNPVELNNWKQAMAGAQSQGSGSTNTSFTAELNYIQTGGTAEEPDWSLQYFRLSAGAGASYDWNGTIPIASFYGVASVDAYHGGSIGASAQGGIFEVLGSDTISYLITVYNGLVYTQAEVDQGFATDRFGRWKNYRTAHRPAMKAMIMKIGDPESNVYQEATGSYGLSTSDPLIAEAARCKETGKVSDTAEQLFENFLRRNYEQHRADGTNTERDPNAYHQATQGDERTPWYRVVGGSSEIFVDMANQYTPKPKRSKYEPARQSPTPPTTILDSVLQEQDVSVKLRMRRREEGGIFTAAGGDKISSRDFSISKRTDEDVAVAKVAGKIGSILDSPDKFNLNLIRGAFRGTNLEGAYNAYVNAKSQPTGNRGQNRTRSQRIQRTKANFMAKTGPAFEALGRQILNASVQDNSPDIYFQPNTILPGGVNKLRVN